jgi:hypothetical protein
MGSMTWGSNQQLQELFLFCKMSRPALGPTCPCIQWVYEGSFLVVKWPVHEADYLPPSGAKVKNEENYTFAAPICLDGVGRGNFFMCLIFIFVQEVGGMWQYI